MSNATYPDIQGNILKFHGRPQAHFLIGKFKNNHEKEVRNWLKAFASKYIKSDKDQADDTEKWKSSATLTDKQEKPLIKIALSSKGYEKAGFKDDDPAFPKDEL